MALLDEKCLSLWMSSLDFASNLSFYVVYYRYVYLLRIWISRDLNDAQVRAVVYALFPSLFLSLSFVDEFFGIIFDFVLACSNHVYTLVVSLCRRFIVVLWFLSFNRLRFCLSGSTSISSFGCSMWRVQCTHTNNHPMCQYLLLELTYSFSCLRIKFCLPLSLFQASAYVSLVQVFFLALLC